MLTPNYGCVGATDKFTCSDTVFASLVMFFVYVDNPMNRTTTTISFIILRCHQFYMDFRL